MSFIFEEQPADAAFAKHKKEIDQRIRSIRRKVRKLEKNGGILRSMTWADTTTLARVIVMLTDIDEFMN